MWRPHLVRSGLRSGLNPRRRQSHAALDLDTEALAVLEDHIADRALVTLYADVGREAEVIRAFARLADRQAEGGKLERGLSAHPGPPDKGIPEHLLIGVRDQIGVLQKLA
jgi:hypothetical protein